MNHFVARVLLAVFIFVAVLSPGFALASCGDANGDGMVDFADLNVVLANWGTASADGDVNCDGLVDFQDLNELLADWGTTCQTTCAPACP